MEIISTTFHRTQPCISNIDIVFESYILKGLFYESIDIKRTHFALHLS